MRETAACFLARLREQGGGIASNAFGKTASGTAGAQERKFEERGTPDNVRLREP